ncbi:MAG: hypothetical protein IKA31_03600 [Clostridia bacterium]|nr:hypothetical protein [Clostridia bacterium]
MTESTFTMFVHTDNIKDIETLEEYLILTQKPCLYSDGKYSIIVFTVLDQIPECYDPETMLEVMGGLVLHEDGSNCFLMLESDIPELEKIFCWDGAANILMGELLSVDDKITLLERRQEKLGYTGHIQINIGERQNPKWADLSGHAKEIFEDTSSIYKLGDKAPETDVWWPFLLEEDGGFNIVVQQTPVEEPKQLQYPLATRHPNPWDPEDDDFFNDYDGYDWMHMHHCGGYQF